MSRNTISVDHETNRIYFSIPSELAKDYQYGLVSKNTDGTLQLLVDRNRFSPQCTTLRRHSIGKRGRVQFEFSPVSVEMVHSVRQGLYELQTFSNGARGIWQRDIARRGQNPKPQITLAQARDAINEAVLTGNNLCLEIDPESGLLKLFRTMREEV